MGSRIFGGKLHSQRVFENFLGFQKVVSIYVDWPPATWGRIHSLMMISPDVFTLWCKLYMDTFVHSHNRMA